MEIGRKIVHLTRVDVLGDPNKAGKEEDGQGKRFSGAEKTPGPKLPKNQQPFEKCKDIHHRGVGQGVVVLLLEMDDIASGQFSDEAAHHENKKGLISIADAAKTYQPCYNGYDNRQAEYK